MRPNSINSNAPCPFKVSDRIRSTAMFENHGYRRGESYEIVKIDSNDSTLKARDENGQIGGWIRWSDCEISNSIGWEWLKGQLPTETLELLSAFDGLHALMLRPDIRIALIHQTPALKDRILDACEELESNNP